ncbi:MAG TPA: M23 family metallopeptidase [Candidatus Acidoferrales bacterium]
MKPESYTLFMASNRRGTIRRITVPFYALHVLAALSLVGGITVAAGVGSYTRMLWKVGNYNALRRKHDNLQQQYQALQKSVTDTDERLSSLQSLATEVAMTYGFVRLQNSPFGVTESAAEPEASFEHTVAQFNFLEKNATQTALASTGLHLVPTSTSGLGEMTFTPSLWPVIGPITGRFGERLDPFSGEGAFHTGVDISSPYGESVRATADGVVIEAAEHVGYGRLVEVDHGFGVTTWYGHLSSFAVPAGMHVKRGDIIGYVGVSGRTTGPHVHYEVRIHDAPVNPMRYLRFTSLSASTSKSGAAAD